MEPITTAIAAVTAASKAIDFIKARINDVQSVSEISEQVSTLFKAQQKLNEERNKQAGVGDVPNIRTSIDAVLEAKKLQQDMREIATLICLRWPRPADQPSTWQEILNHHNQALREQKEARRKAEIEARRKRHQMEENIKAALLAGLCIAIGAGALVLMFSFISRV
tara:strand:+ start:392 stop:889 length:498 start_codon:yes stop_codon:yes gene_type:complete